METKISAKEFEIYSKRKKTTSASDTHLEQATQQYLIILIGLNVSSYSSREEMVVGEV